MKGYFEWLLKLDCSDYLWTRRTGWSMSRAWAPPDCCYCDWSFACDAVDCRPSDWPDCEWTADCCSCDVVDAVWSSDCLTTDLDRHFWSSRVRSVWRWADGGGCFWWVWTRMVRKPTSSPELDHLDFFFGLVCNESDNHDWVFDESLWWEFEANSRYAKDRRRRNISERDSVG